MKDIKAQVPDFGALTWKDHSTLLFCPSSKDIQTPGRQHLDGRGSYIWPGGPVLSLSRPVVPIGQTEGRLLDRQAYTQLYNSMALTQGGCIVSTGVKNEITSTQ